MEAILESRATKLGKHQEITERVIGVFYDVYKELGHGFLESVYRESMRLALMQAGLNVRAEVSIQVSFRGTNIRQQQPIIKYIVSSMASGGK
jgi:GxxExxY protein